MRTTIEQRTSTTAAGQLGLITRRQARALGASDRQLDRSTAAGRYEALGCGVFALAGTPWTWERRALAALLAAGPDAHLSHRSAAHALGFDGYGECPIEITLPRGHRCRTALALVHTTTRYLRLDLARVGRFRVTSGARTIIDLGAARVSEAELSAAIGSALRDGWSSEPFLRKRLAALRGPGRHGVVLLDRVLAGPIGHSHLERAFLALVRRSGVSRPQAQKTYIGERVIRVDAVWEDAMVIVEVMGHRFHATREDLQRDAHRRNELQELGYLVLEITADDLARRPMQVMARLRRVLVQRRRAGTTTTLPSGSVSSRTCAP